MRILASPSARKVPERRYTGIALFHWDYFFLAKRPGVAVMGHDCPSEDTVIS